MNPKLIAFSQTDAEVDFYLFDPMNGNRLVTGTAGLGDDALELIDLLLGTTEGTELRIRLAYVVCDGC